MTKFGWTAAISDGATPVVKENTMTTQTKAIVGVGVAVLFTCCLGTAGGIGFWLANSGKTTVVAEKKRGASKTATIKDLMEHFNSTGVHHGGHFSGIDGDKTFPDAVESGYFYIGRNGENDTRVSMYRFKDIASAEKAYRTRKPDSTFRNGHFIMVVNKGEWSYILAAFEKF